MATRVKDYQNLIGAIGIIIALLTVAVQIGRGLEQHNIIIHTQDRMINTQDRMITLIEATRCH
jgi:hypothetical protein